MRYGDPMGCIRDDIAFGNTGKKKAAKKPAATLSRNERPGGVSKATTTLTRHNPSRGAQGTGTRIMRQQTTVETAQNTPTVNRVIKQLSSGSGNGGIIPPPQDFLGPPNESITRPNGDVWHFNEDGLRDWDWHVNDHNHKDHPYDVNGGHYHDWDHSDPTVEFNDRKGQPYVYDEDGNKVYDPNYDAREKEENDTVSEFTAWDKVGAGAVIVLGGIALIILWGDDATGIGIVDNVLIGPVWWEMQRSMEVFIG